MNKLASKKVLIVVTSFDEVKSTGIKTGTWIEEFATPYYLLTDKGIEVTIASPNGGKAPIDPKSAKPEFSTAAVKRFYSDKVAQKRLDQTVKLNEVHAKDYDAVFYPGGHGPMWDLPENPLSIHLIASFYEAGKPVALVCHAPAALKNVKDKSGEPLIKGKQVAGYSNSEETAGQTTAETPFLLEDMLKEKGANYVKGEDWHPFVVASGNLITGQNPASAEAVAEKIIAALADKR
ncbi:putative intracellular protease/amidase [Chitinophaga niastensis]|uniref:Putative intracellular protease/amidase n=1 Tax=Chitinophaga niastensis TaxID=536980 RepID=A0A2P8HDM5_CHINA|nr:type 1 glutamine amidotransferase domain-containing protein [Chitinophaga niastensis]PSL44330.1 putative intracellular protease/amidase [Chitinophaga niastensis]